MKNKTEAKPACRQALEVPAYLQEQLPAEEKKQFEQHLHECSVCARTLEEFKPLLESLRAIPAESSQDLAPAILAKIPAEAWQEKPHRIIFLVFFRVAAVFLCLLAGGLLLLSHKSPRTIPTIAARNENDQFLKNAMAWLLKTQEPNGHWDAAKWGAQKNYTIGITALALTACMKTDPEILKGPYAGAIENGLRYLMAQQNSEGRMGPLNSGTPYNHGLGTLALLEAFEIQERPEWQASIEQALAYIQSTQHASGGWGYPRTTDDTGNTSITAWQLQALLKAEQLGWEDTRPSIDRALAWLDRMSDSSGRIGYSRANEFPNGYEALTAAGALCFLNNRRDKSSESLSRILNTVHHAAERSDKLDYYRNYFLTRALQAEGSEQATLLKTRVQQFVLASQNRSGEHLGSCEPSDPWSSAGGRVYTTAMAVLSLQ
jgi:hypothetical protein